VGNDRTDVQVIFNGNWRSEGIKEEIEQQESDQRDEREEVQLPERAIWARSEAGVGEAREQAKRKFEHAREFRPRGSAEISKEGVREDERFGWNGIGILPGWL